MQYNMGIRNLNRFFRTNASESISKCTMKELSGKTIAVDISVYMYRFATDNLLIENIYLMLALFKHYNIIPLFIFDGKPPIEKRALLDQRKKRKKEAFKEYQLLQEECQDVDNVYLKNLKRQFINISKDDIHFVKQLICAYGFNYYDAPEEADVLCAILAIQQHVWACLSEDMDMCVYGCPRIIRCLSLMNHSVMLYDMTKILTQLNICQKELRDICVLAGTDYNTETEETNIWGDDNILNSVLKYYKQYYKYKTLQQQQQTPLLEFYEWLLQYHPQRITNYKLLKSIVERFDINTYQNINVHNVVIANNPVSKDIVQNILKIDGFLFV